MQKTATLRRTARVSEEIPVADVNADQGGHLDLDSLGAYA
jgi:hypothetical protein